MAAAAEPAKEKDRPHDIRTGWRPMSHLHTLAFPVRDNNDRAKADILEFQDYIVRDRLSRFRAFSPPMSQRKVQLNERAQPCIIPRIRDASTDLVILYGVQS